MPVTSEQARELATDFLRRKGYQVVNTLDGVEWQAGRAVVAYLEVVRGILGYDVGWEVVFDELLSPEGREQGFDHWVRVHVDFEGEDTWLSPIQ